MKLTMEDQEKYYDEHKKAWKYYSEMTSAIYKGKVEGRAEGITESKAEGIAEGIAATKLNIARSLLEQSKISVKKIAAITGLSNDIVEKMRTEQI